MKQKDLAQAHETAAGKQAQAPPQAQGMPQRLTAQLPEDVDVCVCVCERERTVCVNSKTHFF